MKRLLKRYPNNEYVELLRGRRLLFDDVIEVLWDDRERGVIFFFLSFFCNTAGELLSVASDISFISINCS